MNRLLTLFALGITLAATTLPGLALAATDGTLGDSSSGTADITFNVSDAPAPQIQVSGLKELSFATSAGAVSPDPLVDVSSVCVYMTGSTAYTIDVTATPLISAQFQNIVPYRVSLLGANLGAQTTFFVETVTDQTVIQSQTELSLFSDTSACTGENPRPFIAVGLDPTAPPMEAGIATATITLTVSPE